MKDYYKTLGVEKGSSKAEIKKAFHKLAHKYHPDKPNGDEKKFKEVNEAYQTLSSDQKKAQYDQFGSAGPGAGAGGQGFGGFDFSQYQQQGGQGFEDFDLGDIFGSAFGFGGQGRGRSQKGRDLVTEITISFEESIFAANKTISLSRTKSCDTCSGTGAKPGSGMVTCSQCDGLGKVQAQMMGIFSVQQTCPTCNGSGNVPKERCSGCKGAGIVREKENIEIKIPSGISDGDTLRMTGKGEAVKGGVSGDLYIKISVKTHKIFKRDGIDLRMDYKVNLKDVLLGASHYIEALDKEKVELKIPVGTQFGEEIKIKKKGIPAKMGDLYVKIIFDIPKKLSRKDREALENIDLK